MRRSIKALAVTSAVIAGLAAAPVLYAHDSKESGSSMMGSGMMGQMSAMREGCNKMMQSVNHGASGRPNDQWRKDAPRNEGPTGKDG